MRHWHNKPGKQQSDAAPGEASVPLVYDRIYSRFRINHAELATPIQATDPAPRTIHGG
jgi:hypothetical protein